MHGTRVLSHPAQCASFTRRDPTTLACSTNSLRELSFVTPPRIRMALDIFPAVLDVRMLVSGLILSIASFSSMQLRGPQDNISNIECLYKAEPCGEYYCRPLIPEPWYRIGIALRIAKEIQPRRKSCSQK